MDDRQYQPNTLIVNVMKYYTRTLFLVAFTLAHSAYFASLSYVQAAETHHKLIENACDRLRERFQEVLLASDSPGGMVILPTSNCDGLDDFDLRAKEGRALSEHLELLVEAVPTYRWQKIDGVVNLEPKDTKVDLLDARVAYFAYNPKSDLDSIVDSILHTSEVRKAMANSNLSDGLYFGGLQSPPSKELGAEVVLHNKSIREILNYVAQGRKRGIWLYSEQIANNARTFTLKFVVK